MSNVSSSQHQLQFRYPAWATALITIGGVGMIFTFAPVIASIPLLFYIQKKGWTDDQINQWVESSVTAQFMYVALSSIVTLLAVWLIMKMVGFSRRDIGLIRPKAHHPLIGLLTLIPYFAVYFLIAAAVNYLVPAFNVSQEQQIGFDTVTGNIQLLMTFIALVVLAPITEEITMRGLLYTGVRRWLPRIAAALFVSVLFGAAHLHQGGEAGPLWIGALDTFILSLFMIVLREKTGNLWAGVALHMAKNGVAFTALYMLR